MFRKVQVNGPLASRAYHYLRGENKCIITSFVGDFMSFDVAWALLLFGLFNKHTPGETVQLRKSHALMWHWRWFTSKQHTHVTVRRTIPDSGVGECGVALRLSQECGSAGGVEWRVCHYADKKCAERRNADKCNDASNCGASHSSDPFYRPPRSSWSRSVGTGTGLKL